MCYLALTVGRYHDLVDCDGFDVLDSTRLPQLVQEWNMSHAYGDRICKSLLYIVFYQQDFGI